MSDLHLFLIVLGGRPPGRNVEQHDVMFAVGEKLEDTFVAAQRHWPVGVHIDSSMIVNEVDGYRVNLQRRVDLAEGQDGRPKLYFINLGGYRENDLEEYHKKLVIAAESLDEAKQKAKQDVFFTQGLSQKDALTHIDDKMALFGFDVDDALVIDENIPPEYEIVLTEDTQARFSNNKAVPGYRPL